MPRKGKGIVKSKPSRPPEGNESNIPNDGNKGQASKTNNYRGKKPWNKPSPEPKTETDFQGRCTDLEGYNFDLTTRASTKFSRTMKELEQYLGATYSDSCQPSTTTKTASTFPDPEMHTITDLGTERPKTDVEMTYLEKNNTNEAIHQNLRKKDFYKSDMQKIYNIIVGQMNEQLQKKAASDATFRAVKIYWDPIGYLLILKRLWLSNQSKKHPSRSLCLSMRRLYITTKYSNDNTTK